MNKPQITPERTVRLMHAAAAEAAPEPIDLWPGVLAKVRRTRRHAMAPGALTLAAALGIVILAAALAFVVLTRQPDDSVHTASLGQSASATLTTSPTSTPFELSPLPPTVLPPSLVPDDVAASALPVVVTVTPVSPVLVPDVAVVTVTLVPMLQPDSAGESVITATPIPMLMSDPEVTIWPSFEFAYDPVLETAFPHPVGWSGYHPAIFQRPDLNVTGVVYFASIDDLGAVDPQYDPARLPVYGPYVVVLRTVNPMLLSSQLLTDTQLMNTLTDGAFPSEDVGHVYPMRVDAETAGWSLVYWLVVPGRQDIYATADRILYPMREHIRFPAESRLEPGTASSVQFDDTISVHRLIYPAEMGVPVAVEIAVTGEAEAGAVRGTFSLHDSSGLLAEFDAAKVDRLEVQITPREVDEQGMAALALFSPDDFRFAANGQTTLEVTVRATEQAAAEPGEIAEGRVAVALSLDPKLSGSTVYELKPGDTVAVIIAVPYQPVEGEAQFQAQATSGEADITFTVIQGATVIEVDGPPGEASANTDQPVIVTLSVFPLDATTLSWAEEAGLPITIALTDFVDE